jgi:hypothetical protein
MVRCQGHQLFAAAEQERIGGDEERARALLHDGCECSVEVRFAAGFQDMELQPKCACGLLHLSYLSIRIRIVRVHEHGHLLHVWDQFMQKSQPLCLQAARQLVDARYVAARSPDAGYQTNLDRIVVADEDHRNHRGCVLGCECRHRAAAGGDHRHPTTNQLSRKGRQSLIATFRQAVFDREILALHVTRFPQTAPESGKQGGNGRGRRAVENADHRLTGVCSL